MPSSDPRLDTRAELVAKESVVGGVNMYRKAISQNTDQCYISSREVVAMPKSGARTAVVDHDVDRRNKDRSWHGRCLSYNTVRLCLAKILAASWH